MALRAISSRFSRRAAAPQDDDEALLQQLAAQVPEGVLAALRGTSELSEGAGPAGVQALLRRYLAAEKRSVRSAAQRLEQQAAWRRGFGVVRLVRLCRWGGEAGALVAAGAWYRTLRRWGWQAAWGLFLLSLFVNRRCIPPTGAQEEVPNQIAAGKVLVQPPAGPAARPLIVVAVRKHLPPPG